MNPDELHVLLIGIDAYDGGGSLQGCVNDVDAIQGILLDRLGVPAERVTRLVSPRSSADHDTRIEGHLPTLAAITAALDRLAGDEVAPTDRVFIYYSGHGTQLVLEDAEGRRFPREALLPKDKVRGPDTVVLADWELNAAIARIGARCLSATMVLDCCSSAGATRALSFETGTTRFWPTAGIRPIRGTEARLESTSRGVAEGVVAQIDNCQVVAACQADEKAKEADLDGRTMGHLTRSLCERLLAVDPGDLSRLRWGQVWRQVEAAVVKRNPQQRPWLSTGFARAVFGGDPDDRGDVGFAVRRHGDRFQLDVGTLAGVTEGARIAVYGPEPVTFAPLGSPADRGARLGELRVDSATWASCSGTPVAPFTLPEAARGRLVAPGTDARLTVSLRPHVDEAAAALGESPFIQVVDDAHHADLELHRRPEGWILADDLHGDDPDGPRFPPVPDRHGDLLRPITEHYYRYSAPLRLAHACRDLPRMLQLSVLSCNHHRPTAADAQTASLPEVTGSNRARYELTVGDLICIAVHNHSDRDVYVTLIDVAPSGRVFLLGTSQVPARARERFWYGNSLGAPFPVSLPAGQQVGVDRLVAIGTTVSGVDLSHLRQDTGFAELMQLARGGHDRDLGSPPCPPPLEQYTSAVADIWVRN
ncbi:caspase family protein [Geodermatophilus sp. SYSU D00710]